MCRLVAYHAEQPRGAADLLVTDPHALLKQSCGDRRGECHEDGWGIGFFDARGNARCVHSTSPASADTQWTQTAEAVRSRTLLGHVRQASVGSLSIENTHPFVCGRWMFMHNGTINGFEQVAPRLQRECHRKLLPCRKGSTDSELVFYWLLSLAAKQGIDAVGDEPSDPAVWMSVVREAFGRLVAWSNEAAPSEPSRLNFVWTDGRVLFATRWNHSLWWQPRTEAESGRVMLVASEPTDESAWREIPDRSILWVDDRFDSSLEPLD
jgi:glutamine amidotransferase